MALYPTPHNSAAPQDFGKTVLMPGDPLRAKFIAETYLENAKLINNIRGIQGYTGTYKGTRVSVMASGMGMPSIGIYSHELFNFYDVQNIIRIGSAGAIVGTVEVRDIVAGMSACTNSNYAAQFDLPGTYAPTASYELLSIATRVADGLGTPMKVGSLYSSDTFYDDCHGALEWQKMHNVLAVEMEAAALYMEAARAGKNALAICTISDSLVTGEALPAQDRQTTFTQMMEIALNTAVEYERGE